MGARLSGNVAFQGTIQTAGEVLFNLPANTANFYGGVISGPGSVVVTGGVFGQLAVTAVSTYSGPTYVSGTNVVLVVQGGLPNTTVIVTDGGILGGSGTVGNVTVNGGHTVPGNSIGTLNIGGSLVKHRGHHHVELNAAGRSDRINVGGTARLHSGTVVVLPDPGIYANSTTYTILSAAGGITGAYTGISSDFAFMTPTLSPSSRKATLRSDKRGQGRGYRQAPCWSHCRGRGRRHRFGRARPWRSGRIVSWTLRR